MNTANHRESASFRFQPSLMKRLRDGAAKENRSLNNYVESLLLGIMFPPNEATIQAIQEARRGESAGTFDTSSPEAFMKSIFGDEDEECNSDN